MEDTGERRSHFRGKPRPGRRVEVEYVLVDEPSQRHKAFTRNIGVGGAFVVTEDPEPPGTKLELSLEIVPLHKRVELRGEVRWIADGELDACHGMGIKFQGLAVDQLLELNEYFTSLTATADPDE
jgi:uncharacterized protein (TIGR02266 family)